MSYYRKSMKPTTKIVLSEGGATDKNVGLICVSFGVLNDKTFRNHWFLCRRRKTRLNVNYTAVCPYMILCYSLSNHQRLLATTCQHSSLLCQQLLFLRLFAVLFPLRTSFLTKITAFKSKEMSQINRTIVFFCGKLNQSERGKDHKKHSQRA